MTTATDMLASYMAAESAILTGKTIQFNGRTLTNENLSEIRKGRQEWERRVAVEQGRARSGLGYSIATFGDHPGCGRD
jgi:hypothetical protein